MRHKIFLIDEDENLYSKIYPLLSQAAYELMFINKSNLLSLLYAHKPMAVLVNLDPLSDNAIETIQGALAVEYVPTICISAFGGHLNKNRQFPDSTLIYQHELSSLPLLINQTHTFSHRFNKLTQSYETMDLMNEETYKTLNYFIKSLPKYEDEIICQFFKLIFTDNMFLENQPSSIWLITKGASQHKAVLFSCLAVDLATEKTISFTEDSIFNYISFSQTGFFRNIGSEELSDVDDAYEIFPEELLKIKKPEHNLVCYGNPELLLIGMDYNNLVTQYDINILKALTIKIDLFKNIKFQMREVEDAFIYTMNALARAAEGKDDITGHHIKRVNTFSALLAKELKMDAVFIHDIQIAAQMHDVGKIYIDKSILCKPGRLTDEEFQEIQKHTIYGQSIIGESNHLNMASHIARSHHEKYDGSGYPDGLKGEAIPIAARIVALADIYDALRSSRTYKPAFTHEQSYKIITEGDGRVMPSHFDPLVLAAFKATHNSFETAFDELKDA